MIPLAKSLIPRTAAKLVRRTLASVGYTILPRPRGIGGNAYADMASLCKRERPIIFDVGANTGQTIENFRLWFKNAEIHSFEPSPAIFQVLRTNMASDPCVRPWNCALGASDMQADLLENAVPQCSSFLPVGPENGWSTIEQVTTVPVRTLDAFCSDHGITRIDILKTDTQGWEAEVFKGATKMFALGAIPLVFCEMLIGKLYDGTPSFGQLYDFLVNQGFRLVSFYSMTYDKGLASSTDGLFIHNSRLDSCSSIR